MISRTVQSRIALTKIVNAVVETFVTVSSVGNVHITGNFNIRMKQEVL